MLGTEADYYVFESTLKSPGPEITVPEDPVEPSGEVQNQYTRTGCARTSAARSLACRTVPRQPIRLSRSRSTSPATSTPTSPPPPYPAFPGTEADYLRALVGRIASATVVCPAGYFKMNEDGAVEKDEEHVARPFVEQLDLANWALVPAHQGTGPVPFTPPPQTWRMVRNPPEGPEPETEAPSCLSTLDLGRRLRRGGLGSGGGGARRGRGRGSDDGGTPGVGHLHLLERPGGAVPGGMRQVAGVAGRRRGVFGGEVCQLLRGVRVPREKVCPAAAAAVAEEFDLGGRWWTRRAARRRRGRWSCPPNCPRFRNRNRRMKATEKRRKTRSGREHRCQSKPHSRVNEKNSRVRRRSSHLPTCESRRSVVHTHACRAWGVGSSRWRTVEVVRVGTRGVDVRSGRERRRRGSCDDDDRVDGEWARRLREVGPHR